MSEYITLYFGYPGKFLFYLGQIFYCQKSRHLTMSNIKFRQHKGRLNACLKLFWHVWRQAYVIAGICDCMPPSERLACIKERGSILISCPDLVKQVVQIPREIFGCRPLAKNMFSLVRVKAQEWRLFTRYILRAVSGVKPMFKGFNLLIS